MKNARFWVWWNGQFTKLTLKPGQTLKFARAERTDEGFSSEYQLYWYDEDTNRVICELTTNCRDCDGRSGWQWDGFCHIDSLKEVFDDEYQLYTPDWKRSSEERFDQYAQMSNF